MFEYRDLHWDGECRLKIQLDESRAEYRPGGSNIELYIRMLNLDLNADLEVRI